MQAMVLEAPGKALAFRERGEPEPGPGMVRIRVGACGVCRTDLHVVDGELPDIRYPIVPGHEVVGRVDTLGPGVTSLRLGERVGDLNRIAAIDLGEVVPAAQDERDRDDDQHQLFEIQGLAFCKRMTRESNDPQCSRFCRRKRDKSWIVAAVRLRNAR